jgi:hypothetical protein
MIVHGPSARAAAPPEIRLSATNSVPACVTPERLMAFLKSRNPALNPRYKGLAAYYKQHGETWRVRWDYAFFQMAVETNFLTYRRPDGRMGDVDPKQNNFAGIGTTGGGVPGDSFPDVKTGVLAQIQHLVVYSGETVAAPVAPRTQLKQDHILLKSRELNRPVRFSDLARRWAADPKYGQSIEWAAESFRAEHCRGKTEPAGTEVLPWATKTAAPGAQRPGETAAPAANASPAPKEPARAASPVRTIWTRGQKPATSPAIVAAAVAPSRTASIATTNTGAVASAGEPAPSPPAAAESETPTPPVETAATVSALPAPISEPSSSIEEPSPHFALLSPPAMLRLPAPPQDTPSAPPAPTVVASETAQADAESKPAFDPVAHPPSGLGVKPTTCSVDTASFGGDRAVLIRADDGRDVHFIAVTVLGGFEKSMAESFISARAQGGQSLGEFPSKEAALAKARELCPGS